MEDISEFHSTMKGMIPSSFHCIMGIITPAISVIHSTLADCMYTLVQYLPLITSRTSGQDVLASPGVFLHKLTSSFMVVSTDL